MVLSALSHSAGCDGYSFNFRSVRHLIRKVSVLLTEVTHLADEQNQASSLGAGNTNLESGRASHKPW